MTTHRRTVLLGGILATITMVFSSLLPSAASAAAVSSPNGMRVSPVTTNLTINPGGSSFVNIIIQNVTKDDANYKVDINDFTTKGETGTPALLLNPGQYAPAHSLKRYITPIPDISVKGGEQKTIKVEINIPKNAPGGGYY